MYHGEGERRGGMITNRFFFDPQFRPNITRILQKTPEFQKMAIMISLSEFFFFDARTVKSTDDALVMCEAR